MIVNNDETVARCDSLNENFSALHTLCSKPAISGALFLCRRPCRPAGVVSNCPKQIWPAHVGAANVRRLATLPSLNWLSAASPRRQQPITGSQPENFRRPSGVESPSSPSTTRKHSSRSGRCVIPPPTPPPRHPQRGERWRKEKGRVTAALAVQTQTSPTAMITQVSPTLIGFSTATPLGSVEILSALVSCVVRGQATPSSTNTAAPTQPSKNGWSYGRILFPGTSSQCWWVGGTDGATAFGGGCC